MFLLAATAPHQQNLRSLLAVYKWTALPLAAFVITCALITCASIVFVPMSTVLPLHTAMMAALVLLMALRIAVEIIAMISDGRQS